MDEEPKISESQKWLMLGTAIFFDILSLISLVPVIGWILGVIVWLLAFMTFWLWFKLNGMSFSKPKNIGGFLGGSLIELIPYVNLLPGWTMTILYLTRVKKVVDKVTEKTSLKNNIVKFPQQPRARENSYVDKLDRAA